MSLTLNLSGTKYRTLYFSDVFFWPRPVLMPVARQPRKLAPLSVCLRSLPESQVLSPIPATGLCVRLLSTESVSPGPWSEKEFEAGSAGEPQAPTVVIPGMSPLPTAGRGPSIRLSLSSRTGVKPCRSWFSLVSKVSAGDTAFLSSLQRMGQGPQGFSCSEELPLSSWGVSELLGGSKALFRPHACGYYSCLIFSQLCSLPRRPSLVLSTA